MRFLKSLNDQLSAIDQEVQTLPGEFASIMKRLDKGKWANLLARIDDDANQLVDRLIAPQKNRVLTLPGVFDLQTLSLRPITSEDRARWRSARVRVVIGKGKVQLMADTEASGKREIVVSDSTAVTKQQGYIVLNWDYYQKLLGEIGKLIAENEGPK